MIINMTTKYISLAIISLIGCCLFSGIVNAQGGTGPSSNWTYGPASEAHFKKSTQKYYSKEKKDGGSQSVLFGVPCQPDELKVNYGDYGKKEIAHVIALYMAYDYDNWYSDYAYKYSWSQYGGTASAHDKGYCRVFFNRVYRETRANACVTFIHEYGHLLGREHNTNIDSPMYTGYAKKKINSKKRSELFERNRKKVIGRSNCGKGTTTSIPEIQSGS